MNNLGRDGNFDIEIDPVTISPTTPTVSSDTVLNVEMTNQDFDPLDLHNKRIINVGTEDPNFFISDLEVVNKKYVDTNKPVTGAKLLNSDEMSGGYDVTLDVEPYHKFLALDVRFGITQACTIIFASDNVLQQEYYNDKDLYAIYTYIKPKLYISLQKKDPTTGGYTVAKETDIKIVSIFSF